jgi:hypothetical protein
LSNICDEGGIKLPTELVNEISNMFNAMELAILQSIMIYFVAPFLSIILVSRFVLKIRGIGLQLIMGIAAFVCFYFFSIKGLPEMQNIYTAIIKG